jgi:hypothetical protein
MQETLHLLFIFTSLRQTTIGMAQKLNNFITETGQRPQKCRKLQASHISSLLSRIYWGIMDQKL